MNTPNFVAAQLFLPNGERLDIPGKYVVGHSVEGRMLIVREQGQAEQQTVYVGLPYTLTMEPTRVAAAPSGLFMPG